MKIEIKEALSIELEPHFLERAGVVLVNIRRQNVGDNTLDALFVLLLFRALEKVKPGLVATIQKQLDAQIKGTRKSKIATRKSEK